MTGEGFLVLSMICYGFSSGLIKRYGQKEDPVILSGWQFIVGGAVMIAAGFVFGGSLHPRGWQAYLVLLYLAVLSAVAYSLWSMLLRKYPVSKVAVFSFLQPLFGVVLGLLLVHQKTDIPPARYAAALVLVCLCIIVINYSPEEKSHL